VNNITKVRLTTGKNGSGEGFDYGNGYYTPWYQARSKGVIFIMENGITKIGTNTFSGQSNPTYYYTGTYAQWSAIPEQNKSGITVPEGNCNYRE